MELFSLYKKLFNVSPITSRALIRIGEIYSLKKKEKKSRASFLEAVFGYPGSLGAEIGRIYVAKRDIEKNKIKNLRHPFNVFDEILQKKLSKDISDFAQIKKAEGMFRRGWYFEAFQTLEQLFYKRLDSNYRTRVIKLIRKYLARMTFYLKKNQYHLIAIQLVKKYYNTYIKRSKMKELWYLIGSIYSDLFLEDIAVKYFKKSINLLDQYNENLISKTNQETLDVMKISEVQLLYETGKSAVKASKFEMAERIILRLKKLKG